MKGRTQLREKKPIESRRIASVRIYVERAIARQKKIPNSEHNNSC